MRQILILSLFLLAGCKHCERSPLKNRISKFSESRDTTVFNSKIIAGLLDPRDFAAALYAQVWEAEIKPGKSEYVEVLPKIVFTDEFFKLFNAVIRHDRKLSEVGEVGCLDF